MKKFKFTGIALIIIAVSLFTINNVQEKKKVKETELMKKKEKDSLKKGMKKIKF